MDQDTPQTGFPVNFRPRDSVAGFLVWLAIASVVLIAVVVWKGERPLAWRWGD